jgi:hypothetical protein
VTVLGASWVEPDLAHFDDVAAEEEAFVEDVTSAGKSFQIKFVSLK